MNTYKHLIIIILTIIIALALLCFIIALQFPDESPYNSFFYALFQTLLIAGTSGVIYEYFLRGEIIKMNDESSDRVIKQFNIAKGVQELKISEVCRDTNTYDFSKFITESKEIFLLLNDGRTWTSLHEADLSERLANPKLKTHVILVHPDSEFLPVLAYKVGTTPENLRMKIEETIERLESHLQNGHALNVYGHYLPTCFSLFMNEKIACMSSYPMALKVDRLPMYVYNNKDGSGYFHSLKRDVLAIIDRANVLYPPDLLSTSKKQ